MEIELVNKLYNLYLMLLGGCVILGIFTMGYIVAIYRLYKRVNNVILNEVDSEIHCNKTINN